MNMQKILVPFDFSECAHMAFQYALLFQKKYQANLFLLHVLSKAFEVYLQAGDRRFVVSGQDIEMENGIFTYTDSAGEEQRRDLRKEAREKLRALVPASLQNLIHLQVQIGDPAHEILHVAQEARVDLIVMGTHGRTGLSHLWLGSVAERVVRQSLIPVLTIRPLTYKR